MLGKVKKPKYQILTCTYQVNNVSFWKKWNSKSGWNILTKSVLLSETFGEMTLENFLWTSQEFSKHLRSLVSLPLYVSKTLVTIEQNNKKISKQNDKNRFFYNFLWHDYDHKMVKPPYNYPAKIDTYFYENPPIINTPL